MPPIPIMLNGLPGNVLQVVARHALADPRVRVLPYSLTGPEITLADYRIETVTFSLIRTEQRDQAIQKIIAAESPFICVDFTHPAAVNANAEFYCRHGLPFVMGTTGGDRANLAATVTGSAVSAVIAPNMAKQIVGFQAMMAYAAENFPGLFTSYRLTIRESHQAGKADTSGTAKAMVDYFNRMGVAFTIDQIEMERDPQRQRDVWHIPAEHLGGHAWHTYTLTSPDRSALFEFRHNINGREIYGEGSMDAVVFLADKIAKGAKGRVYSMIDVLKHGRAH
jgi:4-hydroxy-tetrahydrodipicolinate reductase